jgi:bacterioferritin-associated ferredoxin
MKTTFNSNCMIVCACRAVSDRDVAKAIGAGACSVEQIAACTRAGTGCGQCRENLQEALDMVHGHGPQVVVILPRQLRKTG